jgi:hypothetical protein
VLWDETANFNLNVLSSLHLHNFLLYLLGSHGQMRHLLPCLHTQPSISIWLSIHEPTET